MIIRKKLSILLILSLLAISTISCSSQTSSIKENTTSVNASSLVNETIKNEVISFGAKGAKVETAMTLEKMLTYAIQDEYLAHAEYAHIIKSLGDQKPFNNIISAEEKHIDLLKALLKKYNTHIPEDTATNYVVDPLNIEEALKTGVQAEIDNIAMYEEFLKSDLSQDVKDVFIEVRDGSKKHLSAFENGLNK